MKLIVRSTRITITLYIISILAVQVDLHLRSSMNKTIKHTFTQSRSRSIFIIMLLIRQCLQLDLRMVDRDGYHNQYMSPTGAIDYNPETVNIYLI